MRPCIDSFESVGARSVPDLVSWMQSGELDDPDLSLAAEVLGTKFGTEDGVVDYLLELLNHQSRYVREGAVLGLERQIGLTAIRSALFARHAQEESPGVRFAIEGALED